MEIVRLLPSNQQHTRVVVSLVVQSLLDYGEVDTDPRLLAWINCQGSWAVAVNSNNKVVGVVCMVHLHDTPRTALLWLEVLPAYQRRGIGTALLKWAHAHATQPLVIQSVSGAVGFYQRVGVSIHA